MERYLEQLIDDMHVATQKLKRPPLEGVIADDEQEFLDFSQVEKYERGEVTPISQITGIDQEQLPPVENLSREQQALLSIELEKLLEYFHFKLDFPSNYPDHLRYPFIRKFWSEEQVAVTFGNIHIEFCDYNEDECPFPGYCINCKDVSAYGMDFKTKGSPENADGLYPFDSSDDEDPYTKDFSGFYDDNGNKIDINSIPVPNLCIICKNYQLDDWDENLLCMMNRNDQSGQPDFKCGAFETI